MAVACQLKNATKREEAGARWLKQIGGQISKVELSVSEVAARPVEYGPLLLRHLQLSLLCNLVGVKGVILMQQTQWTESLTYFRSEDILGILEILRLDFLGARACRPLAIA